MMTEEEAKTKWCQQTYNVDPICNEYGSSIREAGPHPCCGSACMAWRWQPQQWKFNAPHGGSCFENKDTDGYGRKGKAQPRMGYCGLAGKP